MKDQWAFSGLAVRFLEPDALPKGLALGVSPGRTFLRHFDAAQFESALQRTSHTGALDEVAACALGDAVLQLGANGGFLDANGLGVNDLRTVFVTLAAHALQDPALAAQLFAGGVLDRLGTAQHFIGSLPVRVIARQLTRAQLGSARASLTGGWDEDLLNVLESAALRATTEPEALLVLVPQWERAIETDSTLAVERHPPSGGPWVERLREAVAAGASDIVITDEAESLAEEWLTEQQRTDLKATRWLVTSFTMGDLGRFRLTATIERGELRLVLRPGGLALPALATLGFAPEAINALRGVKTGLLVLAGGPGSGRSTTFAAVMKQLAQSGRSCITFEQPRFFGLLGVRQVELDVDQSVSAFRQSTRLLPVAAVGIDVVDDEVGVDLALEAAADGRLAVVVMRSLSVPATVHRLAELDARWSRRRLSEHLSLVHCQRRNEADWLAPTEALRRHLRSQTTPAPPALLGPGSDGGV